ncbi:MAG: site-specific integrase [Prevotella sp.]|nr:site-specific integrase [Candidatus Equicola faecalis]
MSVAKKVRKDGVYIISADKADNPKLCAKILSNGMESLFLEYYMGYKINDKSGKPTPLKRREYLGLRLYKNPRKPEEKEQNRQYMELAKNIRYTKAQEMLKSTMGYSLPQNAKSSFIDWSKGYLAKTVKKDARMMKMALNWFYRFLADSPEYKMYKDALTFQQLTKDLITDFTIYLQAHSKGEGAKSKYQRFKKCINYAVEQEIIVRNPCKGVTIKVDDKVLRKDILTTDEIQRLIDTPLDGQGGSMNPEIRRAFILCCYTGIRFCDVKDLTYRNVDFANRVLTFEQNKTKGHSSNSGVSIPLNDYLLNLIGYDDNRDKKIFVLPSYTMCVKSLRHWVKKAGINKHITWHCARHSFGTNALNGGANVKTVASIMGHSGLQYVERYTRAIDSLKREAIDNLFQKSQQTADKEDLERQIAELQAQLEKLKK